MVSLPDPWSTKDAMGVHIAPEVAQGVPVELVLELVEDVVDEVVLVVFVLELVEVAVDDVVLVVFVLELVDLVDVVLYNCKLETH